MVDTNISVSRVKRESYWSLLFAAVRYRNFRLLWLGSFTEHFGEFMELSAVLWLVNELTHSPLLLTVVGGSRFFAVMFSPLFGGVVADRVNRRNLLMVTVIFLAAFSALLAILTFTGVIQVWHLIAVTFCVGLTTSFNHPARFSLVPNMVKREHLLNAVTIDLISVQASLLVSMLFAGYLISTLGPGPIFLLRVAGCVVTLVWLAMIRMPVNTVEKVKYAAWQSLKEGLSYLKNNGVITVLVVLYILPMLVSTTFTNFAPIYANDILLVGAVGYGFLLAAPGLGSILSIIGVTMLTHIKRKTALVALSGILLGIVTIVYAMSRSFYLSLFMLVILGFMGTGFMSLSSTMIQSVIPDEIRGRVLSWREVMFGLGPAVGILFGAIAQQTGVTFSLSIIGGICVLIFLMLVGFLPKFKRIE